MPHIKFVDLSGVEHVVHAETGQSIMQAGISNLVPDLVSECGGNCACASCHVYVDDTWVNRLLPPQQHEADMLTCVVNQSANSRLSCQVKMTEELDGVVIRIVKNEY